MQKHFNIKVFGKVQGVFFRQITRERARTLGIKGFVRNELDGSVYIEAEGEEESLNKFTEWCKVGPPMSKVDKTEITESLLQNFSSFEIGYR